MAVSVHNQPAPRPEALRPAPARMVRCAIYTRKSTGEGLDRDFNSLDAQREAAEAFILSQRGEGLVALPERYDGGGIWSAWLSSGCSRTSAPARSIVSWFTRWTG